MSMRKSIVAILLGSVAATVAAGVYDPVKMRPAAPEELADLGTIKGMPAYPPPGEAVDPTAKPKLNEQLINYEGSLEH